ncbi:MAG TPA: hypothetical protein VN922_10425 [Bacteroidia bacterium]|nr:hypothetical protein [Bacteroidia bacterium]
MDEKILQAQKDSLLGDVELLRRDVTIFLSQKEQLNKEIVELRAAYEKEKQPLAVFIQSLSDRVEILKGQESALITELDLKYKENNKQEEIKNNLQTQIESQHIAIRVLDRQKKQTEEDLSQLGEKMKQIDILNDKIRLLNQQKDGLEYGIISLRDEANKIDEKRRSFEKDREILEEAKKALKSKEDEFMVGREEFEKERDVLLNIQEQWMKRSGLTLKDIIK